MDEIVAIIIMLFPCVIWCVLLSLHWKRERKIWRVVDKLACSLDYHYDRADRAEAKVRQLEGLLAAAKTSKEPVISVNVVDVAQKVAEAANKAAEKVKEKLKKEI